ncbi:MAG: hypothetical protein RJA87_2260 [Pseudomonadota bacterium]|jgi:hypothetical protein
MSEVLGDDALEDQDYDTYLETYEPSELLTYSTLDQYLNDPYVRHRLIGDSDSNSLVVRTAFESGKTKVMGRKELIERQYEYLVQQQPKWSAEFHDYLLSGGIPKRKISSFIDGVATLWVGPPADRQRSELMLGVKASIRDFDHLNFPRTAGKFTLKPVANETEPFFTPEEMEIVFNANSGLIDAFLPDYIDALGWDGPSSVSDLYVRRGVRLNEAPAIRTELHELSSYSLGVGTVEQFAQLWRSDTKDGVSIIISAPLPAVQNRVVAFAPFIKQMSLEQMELVLAPPVSKILLEFQGEFSDISEYLFK